MENKGSKVENFQDYLKKVRKQRFQFNPVDKFKLVGMQWVYYSDEHKNLLKSIEEKNEEKINEIMQAYKNDTDKISINPDHALEVALEENYEQAVDIILENSNPWWKPALLKNQAIKKIADDKTVSNKINKKILEYAEKQGFENVYFNNELKELEGSKIFNEIIKNIIKNNSEEELLKNHEKLIYSRMIEDFAKADLNDEDINKIQTVLTEVKRFEDLEKFNKKLKEKAEKEYLQQITNLKLVNKDFNEMMNSYINLSGCTLIKVKNKSSNVINNKKEKREIPKICMMNILNHLASSKEIKNERFLNRYKDSKSSLPRVMQ